MFFSPVPKVKQVSIRDFKRLSPNGNSDEIVSMFSDSAACFCEGRTGEKGIDCDSVEFKHRALNTF